MWPLCTSTLRTDGRTDRQTDRQTTCRSNTVLCVASRVKKLRYITDKPRDAWRKLARFLCDNYNLLLFATLYKKASCHWCSKLLAKSFKCPTFRPSVATMYRLQSFYRAMHFSAKRGIAIACRPSVCLSVSLSVCDVGELWSHRLEFFENNFTVS